jgi:HlyD family secretion protein
MTKGRDQAASAGQSAAGVEQLLGAGSVRPWWRRPAPWVGAALLVAAVAGWQYWQGRRADAGKPLYVTQPVARGDLTVTVVANGTLAPTRAVNVGSEMSGTVARVLVDINDRVTKGQVLAELDTAKLSDQIRRSRAAVLSAEARVAQTAATVKEARASLSRMEEVARLSGGKVPSKAELDAARAALERALADARVAAASVVDAKAALSVDETNLRKASIRSPIDGVILTRSVDPGNAVAASLQAVTLFNIAEDLTKMKLQVNVDEADVGQVREGQAAEFTVSAWPGRNYPAKIVRVGFGSTVKDNVVSYVADLEVANDDLSLRPGMTATATIVSTRRTDVLLVPNAALRFTPSGLPAEAVAAGTNGANGAGTPNGGAPAAGGGAPGGSPSAQGGSGSLVSKLVPQFPRRTARRGGAEAAAARQVWVLRDGAPVAVPIGRGVTDGRFTEVTGGELSEGDRVIVEQTAGRAG